MLKINANRWVELVANIGIIGGLLLVGAQMKQSSDLQRLQMLHEESRATVEIELAMLGENPAEVWTKSLQSPRELSLEERRIMDSYFYIFAEQLRAAYVLHQEGLLESGEWQRRVLIDASYFFGNPYGQAWWQNFKADMTYPQELISFIDNVIDNDLETTMQYHEDLLEYLDKIIGADPDSELPQ
jgi:hypothetical protein